jgi:hypothetical protein
LKPPRFDNEAAPIPPQSNSHSTTPSLWEGRVWSPSRKNSLASIGSISIVESLTHWHDRIPPEVTSAVLGRRATSAISRTSLLAWSLMNIAEVRIADVVCGGWIKIVVSTGPHFDEVAFMSEVADVLSGVRGCVAMNAHTPRCPNTPRRPKRQWTPSHLIHSLGSRVFRAGRPDQPRTAQTKAPARAEAFSFIRCAPRDPSRVAGNAAYQRPNHRAG